MLSGLAAVASRLAAVVAVFAAVLVVGRPTTILTVPETLADRRPVQVGPVEPGFPIDFVGVVWDVEPDAVHDHSGSTAVRLRRDGRWGAWIALQPDGAEADGQWASALVPAGDAEAYQVRGVPAGAGPARATAVNTTDGPRVVVGERRADVAGALASCRSRADWGADESLRRSSTGTEVWVPTFHPLQTLTVHHTATRNGDPDPAATVRAIYRYHAIDRGWGDIGYQYLVDEAGVVYEGRWSGAASQSCAAGGTGADFGHEEGDEDRDGKADEMVTGAHVAGWNSGNTGIALLGDLTATDPRIAAVDGAEAVLAELSRRHGVDPTGTVGYVNPVNGTQRTVAAISGHHDWEATQCPGDRLYAQLPTIRRDVKAGTTTTTTTTSTTSTTSTTVAPTTTTVPLSVSSVSPNLVGLGSTSVAVTGTGLQAGAQVRFLNGKGAAPAAGSTTLTADGRLQTTVTVSSKAHSSAWDVRITLSDGRTALCSRCLSVRR